MMQTNGHGTDRRLIYVVDDDASVLHATAMALTGEGYSVECFADGDAFLTVARERVPAAVLLDVHMPGRSGLDILKQLKGEDYPAPILIVTGHGDIPMAVEAIKNGAFDFFEKPFALDHLVAMLATAIASRSGRAPEPALSLSIGAELDALLTQREREVLREIAAGASSKEAGRNLGISPRTIEVHRARILEKLGARNTADLMRIVFSSAG
jgi:FixJ family two-component response regulator